MRDLCQHIMDLVENAVEAGASEVTVSLNEESARNCLSLQVDDNGSGLSEVALQRATDPFYTTRDTRRVGLGLSLLQAAATRSGGSIFLDNQPKGGTRVRCRFGLWHLDRPPLGDVPTTLLALGVLHPNLDLVYRHVVDGRELCIDLAAFRKSLNGAALARSSSLSALKRFLEDRWQAFSNPPSALEAAGGNSRVNGKQCCA